MCAAASLFGLCDFGSGFCWLLLVSGLGGPRLGASSAGGWLLVLGLPAVARRLKQNTSPRLAHSFFGSFSEAPEESAS